MINPYFVKAMENANKQNLGAVINALANSENFELTEKDAISNLTLLFEPNYEIKLANHLDRQNITESAKEYLSGLLKLKGIKETENGYTLNIEEIPQLRGFSNQTLKGLGIDYKELVSYLISANI
ncbi:MAG TPA: hypothetical protein VI790_02075 [Candidatus Nanoarchaeia archaeon]|nr:hypothetical protein [Candidatus Nanoarchaeia archaeon]